MQNVGQSENRNIDKVNVQLDVVKSSTPQSSASSPAKSETETYSGAPAKYMTDSSESEDDSVSEAEMEEEGAGAESSKFLLSHDDPERAVDPEMQARLEALLEAAGLGKLSGEGKHLADPEVLRRLTSSVSCALDEAAAALTRMRTSDQPPHHQDKPTQCGSTATGTTQSSQSTAADGAPSLAEACSDGDVGTVRKLLTEGRSVHETTEEGESLLSLACSAGYYELAQVLLAMQAGVEDRGIKGDCTPLMEAASAGHVDIVRLLIAHGADVNAVSGSNNTPLMYACAGGHEECVRVLLENGANVEDHNENGHTPLMEAASAGHVGVAKILLEHGAGINTHSNEFKESALTLACYKGHLDMVRFLLAAGADREHKTDEMHTALMEASMDGHVEVARLLLDSGAQVNMPTDSFESPLTLAACGGHVELAMLLLERGANIEEVNDEGYTPLMEAAREGHEEMVALLLGQGASINAQTEETQETALTLACCGGFLEVADFLIKAGADIELGASTPLMEASQEGHLELVRYLLNVGADVHAQTQTGDTALTYACENGHTDVAELLLRAGAKLEHESEGGRTPLMKACRAGHLCTVQFLVGKGANVNRMTANGDHTPLSLACAGGHVDVVKFLLACDADPFRKLKDNSTMLIEAAKGGHTAVVQLLLDYPHSVMLPRGGAAGSAATVAPPAADDGLSAAQAAALGLAHAPAPGAPHQRALLPAVPEPQPDPNYNKLYNEAYMRKKQANNNAPPPTPVAAGVQTSLAAAGATGAALGKHKCPRKARVAPHPDHHLPPPPDIIPHQRPDALPSQPRNESLPETERSMLELADNTGVTTIHLPTTPPYPPPEQLFTAQQLATNLTQHQLQELQQQQFQQFAAQQQQQQQQLQLQNQPSHDKKQQQQTAQQQQTTLQQQQYAAQELQHRFDNYVPQPGEESAAAVAGGVEARELGAVLAYLQREVPSLVALPPSELRSLVLQVMQQKSHEILSSKCESDRESDRAPGAPCGEVRRLLAAAEQLASKEQHAGGDGCQYRCLTSPPAGAAGATGEPQPRPRAPQDQPQPHFALPPPTMLYDDYRAAFVPPHPQATQPPQQLIQPPQQAAIQQQPVVQPQPHTKRDHPSTAVVGKKKGRASGCGRAGRGGAAGAEPYATPPQPPPAAYCAMDVDGETDSNHDTALTLACAGGHEELVELLLSRGADIEHRDKKGFTPLILAATAGHEKIVEILLNHGADIEAQSERTKDTPLSLACSGGRYEVVELILSRGANKEHRNVSDYTPLSLAASGGYVNIIRLLLAHQAEINSRTGSKLGISPLMLAAMNGHTAAVRLLLDSGSDINAQIETNRNTALTLACFQGRHEVVSLLLDRKANVEHRAKTGLTPLMEAASGGYVEVGRVLLDKGADVNAPPVPSSRDTALTIAADKGHTKFVELLLQRRAAVEVKNKKGNSPLWLAANGGHLAVVEMLYAAGADIDSQDNRKVSCLMAAFRKGHVKVVKWMVNVVTQFPSDQEMTRYICTISDKDLLEKCQECVKIIRAAKETQAARANQNATILLEELESERCREESRRQAAARRRERKKKKKMEKKEERRKLQEENDKNCMYSEKGLGECSESGSHDDEHEHEHEHAVKEEGDSGIDANSQGSCSSSDVKAPPAASAKTKKKKKEEKPAPPPAPAPAPAPTPQPNKPADKIKPKPEVKAEKEPTHKPDKKQEKENVAPASPPVTPAKPPTAAERRSTEKKEKKPDEDQYPRVPHLNKYGNNSRKTQVFESTRYNVDKDENDATDKNKKIYSYPWELEVKNTSPKGNNASGKREEGWKEVVRKSSVQTVSTLEPGVKKVSVASHAISRVIGRAGSNINAIRAATGAHIEVDKQSKGQGERIITIKGTPEATKQAANLIAAMIRDPEADIGTLVPRGKLPAPPPMPVAHKQPTPKTVAPTTVPATVATTRVATSRQAARPHTTPARPPPRLQHHVISVSEKRPVAAISSPSTPASSKGVVSYTGAIVGASAARSNTFAAKLTATTTDTKPRAQVSSVGASPLKVVARESAPTPVPVNKPEEDKSRMHETVQQMSPDNSSTWNPNEEASANPSAALHINTTPQTSGAGGTQEYSLFKEPMLSCNTGMWGGAGDASNVDISAPQQVDASKAPGYRGGGAGGGCSPCSRTSSHESTPPPPPPPGPAQYHQPLPIGAGAVSQPSPSAMCSTANTMDMTSLSRNGPIYQQDNSRNGHNMMVNMSGVGNVGSVGNSGLGLGYVGVEVVTSRLNPRAPDFRHTQKHAQQQLFPGGNTAQSNAANLSTLLMSYQQQQQPKPMHQQQPPMPYPSLLDRGVGVSNVGAVGNVGVWSEEEERKPRPIGIERAWKMTNTDDWHHHMHHQMTDQDRYQVSGMNVGAPMGMGQSLEGYGAVGSGAVGTAGVGAVGSGAALSLLHTLPLQYAAMPAPPEQRWDLPQHPQHKQQTWSKWSQ